MMRPLKSIGLVTSLLSISPQVAAQDTEAQLLVDVQPNSFEPPPVGAVARYGDRSLWTIGQGAPSLWIVDEISGEATALQDLVFSSWVTEATPLEYGENLLLVSPRLVIRTDGRPLGTWSVPIEGLVEDQVAVANGRLYFLRRSPEGVIFLAAHDPPETILALEGASVGVLSTALGRLWFSMRTGDEIRVFSSDGTPKGTVEVEQLRDHGSVSGVVTLGSRLLVPLRGGLFAVDPTTLDATRLTPADLEIWTELVPTRDGSSVWFGGSDGNRIGYWRSDGTVAGTTWVFLRPHTARRNIRDPVVVNEAVFVTGWSSALAAYSPSREGLLELGRHTALVASESAAFGVLEEEEGEESVFRLVRIDAGDLSVREILRTTRRPALQMRPSGGVLAALPGDGEVAIEAFDDAGEPAGRVATLPAPPASSAPYELAGEVGGAVLLDQAGWLLLADPESGSITFEAPGRRLQATRERALFLREDLLHGLQLHRLDSTGSELLRAWGAELAGLGRVGRTSFIALRRGSRWTWWRSDGTADGTGMVHPELQEEGRSILEIGGSEEVVDYLVEGPDRRKELWRDGSTAARRVAELELPGSCRSIHRANGRTISLLRTSTPENGWRWVWIDEAAQEAVEIISFPRSGQDPRLVQGEGRTFILFEGRLFSVTGTTAREIAGPSSIDDVVPTESGAMFTAHDEAFGRELFRWTEGEGVALVADIAPGRAGSHPTSPTRAGSSMLFTANDRILGRELWVTDGTSGGTRALVDLRRGPLSGVPRRGDVVVGSRRIYFFGHDDRHGTEAFFLPVESLEVDRDAECRGLDDCVGEPDSVGRCVGGRCVFVGRAPAEAADLTADPGCSCRASRSSAGWRPLLVIALLFLWSRRSGHSTR